jgi:hypothetical protein
MTPPWKPQAPDVAGGRLGKSNRLDHFLVTAMTLGMKMLTVSKAKAQFSGIARRVVRSRKPVIVRVPDGFIQIGPYELPSEVPAFPKGSLKLMPDELHLHNTFGESQ